MRKLIITFTVLTFWAAILLAEPPSGKAGESIRAPSWSGTSPERAEGIKAYQQVSAKQIHSNNKSASVNSLNDSISASQSDTAKYYPAGPELGQNYPNPFNSATEIKYGIPERSSVRIAVYNIFGKKVRTIKDEIQDSGYYSVNWDGRDDNGDLLPSGMYFYIFASDDNYLTRKMMFLK
jgi:hypothetical protein